MNSLLGYGSDDDYEDSADEKTTETDARGADKVVKSETKQMDANYDEVQMDLSEESNDGRNEKDNRRSRDKERDKDKEKYKRRDERNRDRERDRDRFRDRRDRDQRDRRSSSNSKDVRYSRDRRDRNERRSRSPRRSRSRSRDRPRKTKRYDRFKAYNNKERTEVETQNKEDEKTSNDRFFMPGITGRFREQIERRKLLWQKKEPEKPQHEPPANTSTTKKVWEATTFAQDTDGKVANKFKRLMGMKNSTETSNSGTDVLKKQEEMFSSMEQQYEVARTTTHTMRGVGLGFGSFQR